MNWDSDRGDPIDEHIGFWGDVIGWSIWAFAALGFGAVLLLIILGVV